MSRTPPFEPGDRIRVDLMPNDPDPIPPGTAGTVESVDHLFENSWQVRVNWDIKRSLSLVIPPDIAVKL